MIVDTAPGWGPVTISALLYVQELLAPVSMELQAVHGLLAYPAQARADKEGHQTTGPPVRPADVL